jgi:hypothetical protein
MRTVTDLRHVSAGSKHMTIMRFASADADDEIPSGMGTCLFIGQQPLDNSDNNVELNRNSSTTTDMNGEKGVCFVGDAGTSSETNQIICIGNG